MAPDPLVPLVSTPDNRVALATTGVLFPLMDTVICPVVGDDPMARKK